MPYFHYNPYRIFYFSVRYWSIKDRDFNIGQGFEEVASKNWSAYGGVFKFSFLGMEYMVSDCTRIRDPKIINEETVNSRSLKFVV